MALVGPLEAGSKAKGKGTCWGIIQSLPAGMGTAARVLSASCSSQSLCHGVSVPPETPHTGRLSMTLTVGLLL